MAKKNVSGRRKASRLEKTTQCAGECPRLVPLVLGVAFCPTCWSLDQTLKAEGAESVAALAERGRSRNELLFRISDLLRRCAVDDAETLIAELTRRIS